MTQERLCINIIWCSIPHGYEALCLTDCLSTWSLEEASHQYNMEAEERTKRLIECGSELVSEWVNANAGMEWSGQWCKVCCAKETEEKMKEIRKRPSSSSTYEYNQYIFLLITSLNVNKSNSNINLCIAVYQSPIWMCVWFSLSIHLHINIYFIIHFGFCGGDWTIVVIFIASFKSYLPRETRWKEMRPYRWREIFKRI